MTDLKNISSCPFCDASVKASVFYKKAEFLSIYNIAPVLPGHSLIIPVKHYSGILELNDQELYEFFETARITVRILMKAFHTDSFDWSIQEKPEAGQTIEHLHLHIVPRLKDDLKSPGAWYPLIQQNDADIMDSFNRPRLNSEAMVLIVRELKQVAATIDSSFST
ncbi:MAG: HIT domain-containing protein [Bacteroidales bacterium]|nr:HIT domain-containing protein [Bacteroidales bacterium]